MSLSLSPLTISIGDNTVSAAYKRPERAFATLVVAHGAGAGMDHPFLLGFSAGLADQGVATLRFNFPYREAGRKFPDKPPTAIAAWRVAMDVASQHSEGQPVWAGGKSFGGRMASMAVAEGMPAAGLVYLGYPLHPPGKPEKVRDEHLYGLTLPMLFLQGTVDPFVTPALLESVVTRIGGNATLKWMEGGDHSFGVKGFKRSPEEVGASLAEPVADFLRAHS
jgi:predicted alpha/beta-hydrolase family hydrolase